MGRAERRALFCALRVERSGAGADDTEQPVLGHCTGSDDTEQPVFSQPVFGRCAEMAGVLSYGYEQKK